MSTHRGRVGGIRAYGTAWASQLGSAAFSLILPTVDVCVDGDERERIGSINARPSGGGGGGGSLE